MADVASDLNAEVTADGAHGRLGRHGGAEHLAALEDNILSLPDHGADGSAGHVGNQTSEEALAGEVGVMLLHVLAPGRSELHCDKLVPFLFETLNNVADEAPLDAVRLDHDVCEGNRREGWYDIYTYM